MSAAELELITEAEFTETTWETVCDERELTPNLGVRALVGGNQVALFCVQGKLYAISAIDPFSKAAVLSRGLVGDLRGRVVVASPLYKQHFDLATGHCLEDESVRVETFRVRRIDGKIEVAIQ